MPSTREHWPIKIDEVARHIVSMEHIWRRLSKITATDWIDGDLEKGLRGEIRNYAISRQWVLYGPDQIALVTLLRALAKEHQDKTASLSGC